VKDWKQVKFGLRGWDQRERECLCVEIRTKSDKRDLTYSGGL
jgi:hypothetical protein